MPNATALDMVTHRVDLLRLEASTRGQVLSTIDQMGYDLERLLASNKNLTAFSKQRLNDFLRSAEKVINDYYSSAQGQADAALDATAKSQAAHAVKVLDSIQASVDTSLPSTTFLAQLADDSMIFGAPSADWWARQSKDTAFRFAAAVRQGLVAGETSEQIVRRVVGSQTSPGIMTMARRNARSLVHASVQTVANDSVVATLKENSDVVEGMQQISTLDDRTSDVCIAYGTDGADGDGAQWDLNGDPLPGTDLPFLGGPPRHWGCRSVLVPVTTSYADLGVPIDEQPRGMRASSEGPTGHTFESWLESRTPEEQDEQLGTGRAELWRDGKITLQQLLDLHGNPLTAQQLTRRYGGS